MRSFGKLGRGAIGATVAIAFVAVPAAPASAATAARDGSIDTITYTASPGEANDLKVTVQDSTHWLFTERSGVTVVRGNGCPVLSPGVLRCRSTGITRLAIKLDDGNDKVDLSAMTSVTRATVDAGDGNDSAIGMTDAPNTLNGSAGNDVLTGGNVVDTFDGGVGNDLLQGGEGADVLAGGDDDDLLDGGASDDTLQGGNGNDYLDGGPGADKTAGGAGQDAAGYASRTAAVSLSQNDGANDGEPGEGDNIPVDIEQLVGGQGEDRLVAYGNGRVVRGNGGDDVLRASGGHCSFEGGQGDDDMANGNDSLGDEFHGGDGIDVVSYESSISVTVGDGQANDGGSHGSEGDNVFGDTEVIAGSDSQNSQDEITGDEHGNLLIGRNGSDVIKGGGGEDVIADSGADVVAHQDLLPAWLAGRLPANIASIGSTSDGLNLHRMYGGEGDDLLLGGPRGDELRGDDGNDTIDPGDGRDGAYGGGGDDLLLASPGDDYLSGSDGRDTLDYSDASAPVDVSIDGAGGSGTASESDTVETDIEVLKGSDFADTLVGSEGDDELRGGPGADRIFGRGGADELFGAEGDDELHGGGDADSLVGGGDDDSLDGGRDTDQLSGDGGSDTVDYSSRLDPVNVTIGTGADDGEPGEVEDVPADVENARGGAGADALIGDGGPNRLDGGGSSDTLQGAEGDDWLQGGDGGDSLDGGPGGDRLYGGTGIDTVSYADRQTPVGATENGLADDGAAGEGDDIGGDVDVLVGGSAGDTVVGGPGANVLLLGPGNDIADGGAGQDLLDGGPGDDQLRGGAGGDTLDGSIGDDSLDGQDGDDFAAGGAGNDSVTGGSGADGIDGGAGADQLRGRDGFVDRVTCGDRDGNNSIDVDVNDMLAGDCSRADVVEAAWISFGNGPSLRVGANGRLGLQVRCQRQFSPCTGKLSLATTGKVRVPGRKRAKRLTLGGASFSVAPGRAQVVTVTLGRASLNVLRRTGRLKIVVTANGQGAATTKLTIGTGRRKAGKR